jgi:hypothetical protein
MTDVYFLFWDGESYQLQWPPQGGPSQFDLRMPVGLAASPGFLNTACGMTIPPSADIVLWHLESGSFLPKDKSMQEAGVKCGDTVVFVHERLGVDDEVFVQIVTEGRRMSVKNSPDTRAPHVGLYGRIKKALIFQPNVAGFGIDLKELMG